MYKKAYTKITKLEENQRGIERTEDLVRKDQCGMFDTMQVAEKNREMISGITGNMHDGYDIIFKDGHSCHCRTKKDVRSCIIEYCKEKGD
jgi:hypothetical protein